MIENKKIKIVIPQPQTTKKITRENIKKNMTSVSKYLYNIGIDLKFQEPKAKLDTVFCKYLKIKLHA